MNILEEIAARTKKRVAEKKERISAAEMERAARRIAEEEGSFSFPFRKALEGEGLAFICEVKKASPSKGIIARRFPYLQIAEEYEAAGAAAISCLTEPYWFLGADAYLREITQRVKIPVLRKDFTVDPYMIYEAKVLGASAVLLICSLLSDRELKAYRETAESLGLSCLTEAHTPEEVERAAAAGADIIGVNNRNLADFHVDVSNSLALRKLAPPSALFVSESGISTADDVRRLRESGADALLIGEALMRAADKKEMLSRLRKA